MKLDSSSTPTSFFPIRGNSESSDLPMFPPTNALNRVFNISPSSAVASGASASEPPWKATATCMEGSFWIVARASASWPGPMTIA